jgi:TonB-linked SusC/RagA family outer membrane protein
MNHSLGITWTNTAAYDFKLDKNAFNILVGMESYRYSGMYLGASQAYLKEGFDTWDYAYINNGTAATTDKGLSASGNPHDESRSISYFGRLGWNFDERYMINVTVRRDGSSKFADGHRFGTFPSVSAGWNVTNEKFMESTQNWLDFLKIRVSWGRVGNQNIDNYQYLAPITTSNTHYYFGSALGANGVYDNSYATNLADNYGAYPSRFSNENLTWETSEQTNVGFDATLLRSRLSINFDYYIKNTKDWLVVAPILATSGSGAPYINGGSVKNQGVELNLNWHDNIGAFNYSIGVNGAFNKNRVGEIPNEDGIIHGNTNELYDNATEFYRAENGHAIGYFWGYQTAGIFQNEQEIDDWIAAGNGVLLSDVRPGDVKFVDQNHDGVIDDNDKVDLGNGLPKFSYGFNINLGYKNFDFSVTANGNAGNKIVQSYRNQGNKYANYTTEILERWTGEGTSNRIPAVSTTNRNWVFSDLFVHKGDFLRISNITLGYDFAKIINVKAISKARLYAQVQNPFTFTKYNGMDPEIGYGTSSWVSGVDLGYYPRPRTFLFGVNLAF